MTEPRPPARSERASPPAQNGEAGEAGEAGTDQGLAPLKGDDALTRARRRMRAKLLALAPLSAWRALAGVAVLVTAGILRKNEVIQAPGFDLLLSVGLGLLGWQLAADRRNGGAARRNGNGEKKP